MPTDALYSEVLLQAAVERWRQRTLIQRAPSYHVGIDWAASEEGDETIVALVRNGHVVSLHPTCERDTMVQVRWIGDLAAKHGIAQRVRPLSAAPDWLPPGNPDRYNGFPALLIVDEVGVGKGASDRLSELGFRRGAVQPCAPSA